MVGWDLRQPLNTAKKHLIATLRDEIRQPDQQPLRLTIREKKGWPELQMLLWMMSGRPHAGRLGACCRNGPSDFHACVFGSGRHAFGRWRQQAGCLPPLRCLPKRKSVTEVAIAVGYDSVSAFIEMFRTMLGNHSTDILSRQAFVATR